jgi:hypothetical protein
MPSKLSEIEISCQTNLINTKKEKQLIFIKVSSPLETNYNQHEKPSKHNLMNELFDKNNGPAKQPIVLCNSGPDSLAPADSFIASKLTDSVRLRIDDILDPTYAPISIYTAFKNTTEKNPSHPALGKANDLLIKLTRNTKTANKLFQSLQNKRQMDHFVFH